MEYPNGIYLYGKLNKEITIKEYEGSTTDTSTTSVIDSTIKVDVIKVPSKLTVKEAEDLFQTFDGSKEVIVDLTPYAKETELLDSVELVNTSSEQSKLIFKDKNGNEITSVNISGFTQIQTDWNQEDVTSEAYIRNKPTKLSQFENDGDGTSSFATEAYVEENRGKIGSISLNDVNLPIDSNKNVNIKAVEPLEGTYLVYTENGANQTTGVTYTSSKDPNTIPIRDSDGNIEVGAITDASSLNLATNKGYVDSQNNKKLDKSVAEETYYNKTEIDDQGHFENNAPNAQVSVGNLAAGTKLAGLSVKTILKMMVYGEWSYPELTAPSFSYTLNGANFGMYSAAYTLSGILTFDRGSINPAYGTSGKRAGLPYRYDVGGNQIDSELTEQPFSYAYTTLGPGKHEVKIDVYYAQGEQPLDSIGAPYGAPYPAGSMEKTIIVTGLTASFSGIDGQEPTKDTFPDELIPLESKDFGNSGLFGDGNEIYGYQVATPGITTAQDTQIVLLPDSVDIYGIKSWNSLGGGWSWFYGETAQETMAANTWIKTDEVIPKEIDGIAVNYRKYKFNTEDYGLMDENYFRFFLKEVE